MRGAHIRTCARLAALVGLAALFLLATQGPVAAAVVVTTNPMQPLLGVPFFATGSDLSIGSRMFASSDARCTKSVTTTCLVRTEVSGSSFRNGTCIFTLTGAALGVTLDTPRASVPPAHWCVGNPGSAQRVAPLQMHKMEVAPEYVFNGVESALTLGSAVPVGTTLGFYADGQCKFLLTGGGPFVITNERTVRFTILHPSSPILVCASTITVNGSKTETTLVNAVALAAPYTVDPATGVRHQTVVVSSSTGPYAQFYLSTMAHCTDSHPAYQSTTASEMAMKVSVTRGEYFFCGSRDFTENGHYIPASNRFTVLEYDVVPHTLYVDQTTVMTFALDAAPVQSTLEAVLSTSNDCSAASNWQGSWSNPMWWIAKHSGPYYACVRRKHDAATVGYTNIIIATNPPTVALSPAAPVRGVSMRATLAHVNATNAFFVVGLFDSQDCTTLLARGLASPSTSATASLAVPLSARDMLYFCVSNPLDTEPAAQDVSVRFHRLHALSSQPFALEYAPLRVGAQSTITLDGTVFLAKGTTVALVRADARTEPCGATDIPTFDVLGAAFALGPIAFPEAGDWDVCVGEPGANYVAVRRVTVYGKATVEPPGIVAGVEGAIAVSGLPPNALVFVTSAAECDNEAAVLGSATTSGEGAAKITLMYGNVGTLLLCSYYTATAPQPVLQAAGSVRAVNPRVAPAVVALTEQTDDPQVLRFVAPGAAVLKGHAAYLLPGESACPSGSNVPGAATALPALQVAPGSDTPHATLELRAAMVGTRYLACVNTNGRFVAAGNVTVVLSAPRLVADPAPLAAGLPASIHLPSTYTSPAQVDTYAIVRGDADCTADLSTLSVLARGTIDPRTGAATPFLVPRDAASAVRLRVCVAPRHSLLDGAGDIGYAAAGELDVTAFAPFNTYAQLRRPASDVSGWPVHTAAAQYLVRCGTAPDDCRTDTTCVATSKRYSVGGATQGDLDAPRGNYLLCQSVTVDGVTGTVAADAIVSVVDAFDMSVEADLTQIRAYVPFDATVTGGPMGTSFYSAAVQPATVPCSLAASESQTFVSSESSVIINISAIEPQRDVHFCVGPTTTSSRTEVARATLHHYMTPACIFADTPTTITLPTRSAGTSALLSSSRSAPVAVKGGEMKPLSGSRVRFTIDGCGDNEAVTELFYHEFTDGWSVVRGSMLLIRSGTCEGGASPPSIRTVYAAPGAPISDTGVDTRFLAVANIATSSGSMSTPGIDVLATGYVPTVDEDAAFLVWAHPIGNPNSLFTTAAATLRVRNWVVTPTHALSRYNATIGAAPLTLLHISDPTPSKGTFFSQSQRCDGSLGDAADMGTPTQAALYSATGVSGQVYVCTLHPQTGTPLAVAKFTSLLLPQVLHASPAVVRGATYAATLQAEGYALERTNTFLSSNLCAGPLPLQSNAVSTASVLWVSFLAKDIAQDVKSVSLCVLTPAGTGAAIADVPVAPGTMWPTQFAVGSAAATIFVPLSPHTAFQVSATATSCTDVGGMPTFTTDGDGYAVLSLLRASGDALPLGRYAVCAATPTRAAVAASPLETIEVVPAAHFSVHGTVFVVGVPSRMELQQDLHAADLIAGFSTTAACSPVTTDHGTWAALSSTAIEVHPTAARKSGVFLCAQVPANGSVVALPHALVSPSRIEFLQLAMKLPAGSWDTCTDYLVDECRPPGSAGSATADMLTVVHGDCCSYAAQAQAVGSASMASGTCRLRLDAAKVAAYAPDTKFSVCAWNPEKSSTCATLHRVRVTRNCKPSNIDRGSRLSSGTVAGIAVGCIIGGAALLALVMWLVWRQRYACAKGNSMQSDEERPSFSELAETESAREERQRHELLWKVLENSAKDVMLAAQGSGEEVAPTKGHTPTSPLPGSRVTTQDMEVLQDWTPNCMDGWPDVVSKYYSFLDGSDFDYETVSQIPGEGEPSGMDEELEAMLAVPRASALSEELEAKRQAELRAVADRNAKLLAVWEERHRMKEEDPIKLKMIVLQEREEWTRTALEGRCRRAHYNLTVLFKSSLDYYDALSTKRRSEWSESPSDESELLSVRSWDVAPLEPLDYGFDSSVSAPFVSTEFSASVFSPTAGCGRSVGLSSAPRRPQPPPTATQPFACLRNDLYRRRRFLEFPFVTNSPETLIAYDKNVPVPVFVRGLTLVDLQAFHPAHRWLVDRPKPSGSASHLHDKKGTWTFMAPDSTVPFVRRYLMLFKKEFGARERFLEADAAFWSHVFWEKRNVPVFSAVEGVEPVYDSDSSRSFCTSSLEHRNLGSYESDGNLDGVADNGKRHLQTAKDLWAKEQVAPESIVERRRVEQELAALTVAKDMSKEEKKKIAAAQAAVRAAQSAERKACAAQAKAEAARRKAEAANQAAKTAKAGFESRSLSRTRPTSSATVEEGMGQELQHMEELRRLGLL
ncbi:hypothetical protein, unknown function [Leishmania mexicana MHOM/GT/2001/U1103]|uniref:Uncharacterized protein n=1 Tax=Leishmania mexicana (strain MHOM/GT/2001/U1103) TaxID=929439 RepID=E9B4L4_LEIMU|nr:hypothetical protein, unknown function [Leishmania mexicana MHOM/GT/2001/U1103]CBZ30183.1 hypothetical protein, unknown function [Leishmania mexicana MHOM/GT/2001/U1103]